MAVRTCLRIFLFCLMISKVTGLPFPQIALEGGKHFARIQREALIQKLLTEDLYGIAKNVIVFIVDGMGLPLVAASRIYKGQMKGNPGEETMLSFEKFPNIGLMKTYCVDSQVGDSSCTATGIMTGVGGLFKTVGIDAHGKHGDCHATLKVKRHFPTSIMTHAQNAGKGTAIGIALVHNIVAMPVWPLSNVWEPDIAS
ncbi:unnamed protein product [Notodromas monacha]|uniref:alkaline phosphatase n=1 Tax=Notodromas monacha TaxID=399045 RepID=A0A7R9BJE3_9CRUS|nr:unnamed protein product [Notodromas monacha]CAG0915216.1 unnamed protein product [Notodromas monacha]